MYFYCLRKVKELIHLFLQNISPKTLGRLVLDAVERSVDPLSNEIQVFKYKLRAFDVSNFKTFFKDSTVVFFFTKLVSSPELDK